MVFAGNPARARQNDCRWFLADQNLPASFSLFSLLLVEDRERICRAGTPRATNGDQICAVDMPFVNQVFFAVIDHGVQILIVAAFANDDFAGTFHTFVFMTRSGA